MNYFSTLKVFINLLIFKSSFITKKKNLISIFKKYRTYYKKILSKVDIKLR